MSEEKPKTEGEGSKHNHVNDCHYCGIRASLHSKCKHCGFLLHPANPKYVCRSCHKQHTLVSDVDPNSCKDCYIKHLKTK